MPLSAKITFQIRVANTFSFQETNEPTATQAAQRFALLALGRAWTMLGSRKNSKPEKCLKMPQNPQRPVHALLGRELMAQPTPDHKNLKKHTYP
jgi:hypothetical protein